MPNYDLIVVGSGLAGLAAAATASKLKKKTIVLEPGESAGGSVAGIEKGGYRFTPGPVIVHGFERGGDLPNAVREPRNGPERVPAFTLLSGGSA